MIDHANAFLTMHRKEHKAEISWRILLPNLHRRCGDLVVISLHAGDLGMD